MNSSQEIRHYTPEEYFEFEEQAEFKSEYWDGEILAMSVGTIIHNLISGNVVTVLNNQLTDRSTCYVFNSDTKLFIESYNRYVYPDGMVSCGKIDFAAGRKDTICNPIIIIEVLSESTENYDRVEKFQKYMSLASFKEYLIISQDKIQVEHFYRKEVDHWIFKVYREQNQIIELGSISVSILLSDIYRKVDLSWLGD